jgi:hypothetical protein
VHGSPAGAESRGTQGKYGEMNKKVVQILRQHLFTEPKILKKGKSYRRNMTLRDSLSLVCFALESLFFVLSNK